MKEMYIVAVTDFDNVGVDKMIAFHKEGNAIEFMKKQFAEKANKFDKTFADRIFALDGESCYLNGEYDALDVWGAFDKNGGEIYSPDCATEYMISLSKISTFEDEGKDGEKSVLDDYISWELMTDAEIASCIEKVRIWASNDLENEAVFHPSEVEADYKYFETAYGYAMAEYCKKNGGFYYAGCDYKVPVLIENLKEELKKRIATLLKDTIKDEVEDYELNEDRESYFDSLNSEFARMIDFIPIYTYYNGNPYISEEENESLKKPLEEPIDILDEETIAEVEKVAETGEKVAKMDDSWLTYKKTNEKGTSWENMRLAIFGELTLEFDNYLQGDAITIDDRIIYWEWVGKNVDEFIAYYDKYDCSEDCLALFDLVEQWAEDVVKHKSMDYEWGSIHYSDSVFVTGS